MLAHFAHDFAHAVRDRAERVEAAGFLCRACRAALGESTAFKFGGRALRVATDGWAAGSRAADISASSRLALIFASPAVSGSGSGGYPPLATRGLARVWLRARGFRASPTDASLRTSTPNVEKAPSAPSQWAMGVPGRGL